MPKSWNTTRIENRFGGGIPDVHVCAEGLPFWIELKTTKTNRVNAHQVAWNFAYSQSGGVSFFLVAALSGTNLYLFDGAHGRGLAEHGLKSGRSGSGRSGSVGSGTVVPCLWSFGVGSGRSGRGRRSSPPRFLRSLGQGRAFSGRARGNRKPWPDCSDQGSATGCTRRPAAPKVSTTGAVVVDDKAAFVVFRFLALRIQSHDNGLFV